MIREYRNSGANPEERPIAMNLLKELVGNGKTLSKVFKAKRNEVLSFQEKAAKDSYFNMLGCRLMFAKSAQEFIKFLENLRSRERKEAHTKMWKLSSSGLQDTSWCRRATFPDI